MLERFLVKVLYSASHNFIFIRVNKTGSESICAALTPYCVRPPRSQYRRLLSHLPVKENPMKASWQTHQTAAWARRKIPPEIFQLCFKFAFVRNPYDWAVSYFTFIKTRQQHHRHKFLSNMSYVDFLRWQQARKKVPMLSAGAINSAETQLKPSGIRAR